MIRITCIAIILFTCNYPLSAQDRPVFKNEKHKQFKNKVRKAVNPDTIKLSGLPDTLHLFSPDSIKAKKTLGIKRRLDSLLLPNLSTDTVHAFGLRKPSVSEVSLPTDSIQRKATATAEAIRSQRHNLQDKVRSKADTLPATVGIVGEVPSKLTNKLNIKQPETPDVFKSAQLLPNASTPDVAMSGLADQSQRTPELNLSNTIPNGSDVKLPDQQNILPNTNLPELNADKIQDKIPGELPELNAPDSSQLNALKQKALDDERLEKYSAPIEEVTDRIDPYKKNLDSLSVQDATAIAEKEAEQVLQNTDAMRALNDHSKQGKTMMSGADLAALQRYQDKRILKEEMLRKSKNVMNDKLSGLTPQVKDQQNQLGKAKKLNSSVPSVKNLKVKRIDPLKERPVYERIVPGLALQTHGGNVFAIDFAPQVCYRITSYLSAGTGVLYRVGFDKKYSTFISGQGVYGFRTFANYRLVKGLFVHGEYEKINVTDDFEYSDKLVTSGFHSGYVGLGKRYPISRKFNGSLLALYKFEMGDHLTGTTKFNLRVVLEYKTKKIRKPTDID